MKTVFFFWIIFLFNVNPIAQNLKIGIYGLCPDENGSVETQVRKVKDMGVDSIVLMAVDNEVAKNRSIAYFPSAVLPLADGVASDYFEKTIGYAHKYGLKVYAWVNLPHEYFLKLHPDWISILSNGKAADTYNATDYFQRIIPPVRVLHEAAYRNLIDSLIGELCQLGVDGIDLNDNFQWAQWYFQDEDKTLTSSFDDFTVTTFEGDEGVAVPGNSPAEKADAIQGDRSLYEKWLNWRGMQVTELLRFVKNAIVRSGVAVSFRPHLLASHFAKEDYGIVYRDVCRIADVPYTMILLDRNEADEAHYRDLVSLLTENTAKNISVSTYLFDVGENDADKLANRIVWAANAGAKTVNLFDDGEIESRNLTATVTEALAKAKKKAEKGDVYARMGVHIVGLAGQAPDVIAGAMSQVAGTGAKWVRLGAAWSSINPGKGAFDFSAEDALVAAAGKAGRWVLMDCAWTPAWASAAPENQEYYYFAPTESVIGDDVSPFGTGTGYDYLYLFAKAIAEHYRGTVSYFEFWNEEDMAVFLKSADGGDTAGTYAKMLYYFARGIKDGNPDGKVVLGGLADNGSMAGCDGHFLEKILSDSQYPAGSNFDIHNIHTNFKRPADILAQIEKNRALLAGERGTAKEIWITETSYSPDLRFQLPEYSGGEAGFESYLQDVLKKELGFTNGVVFWTPLSDGSNGRGSSDPYCFNGLLNANFSPKTVLGVFRNVAKGHIHTFVIPHIAGGYWHTKVDIFNEGGVTAPLQVEAYRNGVVAYQKSFQLQPLGRLVLSDSEFGKDGLAIATSTADSLHLTLSYQYGESHSISSFTLSEGRATTWIVPVRDIDWFDWCGLAIANQESESLTLTITPYFQGLQKPDAVFTLAPKEKLVDLLPNMVGLDAAHADFLKIQANMAVAAPILIMGNTAQDRHAFFQGRKANESGIFPIDHLAEAGWASEVGIVNPSGADVTVTIEQYGDNPRTENVLVPANSRVILKTGGDLDYGGMARILTNSPLCVTIYYRYKDNHSLCAIPLSTNRYSKHFLIQNNFPGWFDWSGLGFANFQDFGVQVNLIAFNGGEKKGEAVVSIPGGGKVVGVLSDFFPGLSPSVCSRVEMKSDYPVSAPIIISGNNAQDRHTFFNGEALRQERFPQIANYFLDIIGEGDALPLAKRDLIVLDMENAVVSPSVMDKIRAIHPGIRMLAYMTGEEIETDAGDDSPDSLRKQLFDKIQPEWWLLDCNDTHIVFWPGTWMLNASSRCPQVNGEGWNTTFSDFAVSNVLSSPKWDGFYVDNCWSTVSWVSDCMDIDGDHTGDSEAAIDSAWKEGMETMLAMMKDRTRDSLFMGNGGYAFPQYLNGALFEEFTTWNPWFTEMNIYQNLCRTTVKPGLNCINACGSQDNYKLMRYGLSSALMGDGYYTYDMGDETHSEHWYYDEYNVDLGVPLEDGQIVFGSPALSNDFQANTWETTDTGAISEDGISGRSLIGDSRNTNEEWNEYLYSPSGALPANGEIIVEFSYRILEKNPNTRFYVTISPQNDPNNWDASTDLFFGEADAVGQVLPFKEAATLGNFSNYRLSFGIENHGRIEIDNIAVYTDTGQIYTIRHFENGVAICNNSKLPLTLDLGCPYKKISGTQDSATNSGEILSSVTVPAKDGILLLKSHN